MSRSRSEPVLVLSLALALAAGSALDAAAQQSQAGALREIISSEVLLSRNEARLGLELDNGRRAEFAIRDGRLRMEAFPRSFLRQIERATGSPQLGAVEPGSELDKSWRTLLTQAMDASGPELAALLRDWEAPDNAPFDALLEATLQEPVGQSVAESAVSDAVADAIAEVDPNLDVDINLDSVDRLVGRISELQELVDELESRDGFPVTVDVVSRARGRTAWFERGLIGNLFHGLRGVLGVALFYGIVFAIAFATIFFGGRRYIEGVADTARTATTRSLLVGMAASFLVIPVFILGIIALAISIIGIPALLAWVPLFPIAVGLAILLGYIGVAHAAGEALAERRFYATDWFQRGNSYYFLMSGLGLLVAPFVVVNVIRMAGSWLGFLSGLIMVIGVLATWAALSIGLGAVLLSRGGTRPNGRPPVAPDPEIYAETTSA